MNKTTSNLRLSRRDFLKLAATGGVVAAGGYALYEFTPWLNYESQVTRTWLPTQDSTSVNEQLRSLVQYATLAANGHNTQPWKFAIQENAIEIHPDFSRELKVVDPDHRELWISLGCALENLLVAARATGYAHEISYPESEDLIRVNLTPDSLQPGLLFEAITQRQNTRSEYNGQAIKTNDLDQVQGLSLEPGVEMHFVTNSTDLETVLEYVNQGNLNQYSNDAFIDELIYWLRFNKRQAMSSLDGLYSICSGNPNVPGWLGRMFVAGTKPQQQADIDAKKLRSSAGAIVIVSESDDKSNWVRTGQVYERLALQLTSLNIKSAFLNQPIESVDLRSQFQNAMGLDLSLPQLLVRFGYADTMPRSLRRPVEQVLI